MKTNIKNVYEKLDVPLCCYEYETCDFINNSLEIKRSCDKQSFEFLEIELYPNIDKNDFKNICHKISLKLNISGLTILELPLRFIMSLHEYEIVDNKLYLTIPFEMFYDDLILICLQYVCVNVLLCNAENIISSCKLILKKTYVDSPERSNFYNQSSTAVGINTSVQILSSVELNFKKLRNEFSCDLKYGLYKGFFIESDSVDEINEIKLIDNKENIIRNYNTFLIKKKCIKISQNLLYFPMNIDKCYKNRNKSDFKGILYIETYECKIFIKFKTMQTKICIYKLNANILNYQGGYCNLLLSPFFYENICETYDEHDNLIV